VEGVGDFESVLDVFEGGDEGVEGEGLAAFLALADDGVEYLALVEHFKDDGLLEAGLLEVQPVLVVPL